MKTKQLITALCVVAVLVSTSVPAFATEGGDTTAYVVDVAVARPISFAMTVVGTVLFAVSLPFSAASGSTDKAAQKLVAGPAKDTFKRPLGDLEGFLEYW
jgi:hypothetical protein